MREWVLGANLLRMPAHRRWMIPLLLLAISYMAQEQKSVTPTEIGEHLIKATINVGNVPGYPPLARQARIQGKVELTLCINEAGDVTDVRVDSAHPM